MATTRASGSDWREWRRLRAWELAQLGWRVRHITLVLAAFPTAVSRWLAMARFDVPKPWAPDLTLERRPS